MAKDINIHIKTPGAQQAKQNLDDVARHTKGIGDGAQQTEGRIGKLTSTIGAWVLKLASVAVAVRAITAAIRAQSEAIREHAEIAARQQKKLVELQYLGAFFTERPELRQEVEAYAEYGRRPFEEVAGAWYSLRSKGAGLTQAQKDSILRESLELGRTAPSAPLDTLVDMFSLYAKQTGQVDANRIQNVLLQTITEAGGGTSDVARYMPQFLPIGMTGGLSGAEAAGLWSYVTTQLAEPSIATTGLKATFMGLQGRGSPEGLQMLQQLGISQDMSFFQKINLLGDAARSGQFGLAQAEQLAGREGAAVLLSILNDPTAMMGTIGRVVGADTGGRDITGDMIRQLMSQDQFALTEEQLRLLNIGVTNVKGRNLNALQWQVHYRRSELGMRRAGIPEWLIRMTLWGERGIGTAMDTFGIDAPVIINDNSINYMPRVGSDERGPRFDQDMR